MRVILTIVVSLIIQSQSLHAEANSPNLTYQSESQANREIFKQELKKYGMASPENYYNVLFVIKRMELNEYKTKGSLEYKVEPGSRSGEWLRDEQDLIEKSHYDFKQVTSPGHIGINPNDYMQAAIVATLKTGSPKSAGAKAVELAVRDGLNLLDKDFYLDQKDRVVKQQVKDLRGLDNYLDRKLTAALRLIESDPDQADLFDHTLGLKTGISSKNGARSNLIAQQNKLAEKIKVSQEKGGTNSPEVKALKHEAQLLALQIESLIKGERLSETKLLDEYRKIQKELADKIEEGSKDLRALVLDQEKRQAQAMTKLEREAYTHSLSTIGSAMATLGQGEAGQYLQWAGTQSLQVLDSFDKAKTLADGGSHFAAQLTMLNGLMDAGLSLVSLALGGKNINAIILEEVQAIRRELRELGNEMRFQFSLIHDHLDTVYFSLMDKLDRIERLSQLTEKEVRELSKEVFNLQQVLDRTSDSSRAHISDLAERVGPEKHIPRIFNDRDFKNYSQFDTAMVDFYNCVILSSGDSLSTGRNPLYDLNKLDSEALLSEISQMNLASQEDRYRHIGRIYEIAQKYGLDSEAVRAIKNPLVWSSCIDWYLLSASTRPNAYLKYHQKNLVDHADVRHMLESAEKLQLAFSHPTLKPAILNALKENMNLNRKFNELLTIRRKQLTDANLRHAQEAGFRFGSTNQLDPWYSSGDQDAELLKEKLRGHLGSIKPCPNYVMPFQPRTEKPKEFAVPEEHLTAMVKNMRPLVVSAVLGASELNICYDVVDWTDKSERFHANRWKVVSGNARLSLNFRYRELPNEPFRAIFDIGVKCANKTDYAVRSPKDGTFIPFGTSVADLDKAGEIEWNTVFENGVADNGFPEGEHPVERIGNSLLGENLVACWKNDAGKVANEIRPPQGAWIEQTHKIEVAINEHFEHARNAIRKELEDDLRFGNQKLKAMGQAVDGSNELVRTLIKAHYPQASHSAPILYQMLDSAHGLWSAELAKNRFFEDIGRTRWQSDIATHRDKIKSLEQKLASKDLSLEEKEEATRQRDNHWSELMRLLALEAVVKEIRTKLNDPQVVSQLGLKPEEVEKLQKQTEGPIGRVSETELKHLALLLTVLDLKDSEPNPLIEYTKTKLEFFLAAARLDALGKNAAPQNDSSVRESPPTH